MILRFSIFTIFVLIQIQPVFSILVLKWVIVESLSIVRSQTILAKAYVMLDQDLSGFSYLLPQNMNGGGKNSWGSL